MRIPRAYFVSLVLLAASVGLPLTSGACSWAVGYFYQVTALRGRVVGARLGWLQEIPPLRRAFVRRHASLTLYVYQRPVSPRTHLQVVKTVQSDDHGWFDFGAVPSGHYRLVIQDGQYFSDWFDVEVRKLARTTHYVTIDVSPVSPDCSGGHTFEVKTK